MNNLLDPGGTSAYRTGARPHARRGPSGSPSGSPSGRASGRASGSPLASLSTCPLASLSLILLLTLGGCASILGVRPEPPAVTLAGVRPLSLSMTRQQLEFRLRVSNPNRFELPLEALNFTASFAGEDFASGESNEEVTIPARGEAFVNVMVDAGLAQILTRFRSMLDAGTLALDYGVSGTVKLANWPRLIPFDADGVLDNPLDPDEPARHDARTG